MCGIVVGLCFGKLNKKDEEIRQRLLRYFTTELMILTEDRGKDATGAAILFNDGDFCGIKRGERVTDFLAKFSDEKDYYGSLLKIWRDCEVNKNAKIFLGHCRQGTVGDKEDNENNHPIKIGNLVGIHNGVIRNHEIIIDKLGCKRDAKVDSEAIFRLFDHYTNGGKEPFTLDMCQDIVTRLEGQFAVTLFNADNLEQIPIFRDGRPVEFVLIKSFGILLMVSELKFWKEVHFHYERLVHYNPEILGRKMPSLIDDKDNIETKGMDDDTAHLFDLTIDIKADTKIDDLSESKKMSRTSKMWQIPTGYAAGRQTQHSPYNNVGYQGHTGSQSIPGKTTTDTSDVKKHRVFDSITRQYVVKVGDKVVDDKEIVLSADDEQTEETKDVKPTTSMAVVVKAESKDELKSDDDEKEKTSPVAPIEDNTSYNEVDKVAAVGEAYRGIIDAIDDECSIVEVEMKLISPEMIEEAEKAHRELPNKERGYENLNEILNDVNIQDAEVAQTLGEVLLCNRVRKAGWKAGYIAALRKMRPEDKVDNESKLQKGEKHIANLKHMLIILARFYSDYAKTSENDGYRQFLKHRLESSTDSVSGAVDMEEIMKLFNSHEKSIIREAGDIIDAAQKKK